MMAIEKGENKSLREEVMRWQIEVRRLRSQLADLLDANDDLGKRRNDDVLEAETVVASKYEDILRGMKLRYDTRLAAELTEKEKYRQRWMEEVGRNRPLELGENADEDDGLERPSRNRTKMTPTEVVAAAESTKRPGKSDENDGRSNTAPSFPKTSIDDTPDSSGDDDAVDDNAAEVATLDKEGGEDGDLTERVSNEAHDGGGERSPRVQATTLTDKATAEEGLTEQSSDKESGGRQAGASNTVDGVQPSVVSSSINDSVADPSTHADTAIVVVARAEEKLPIDSYVDDDDDDDDDVSRGGSLEIATASLTRAFDRIRELETQLRRQGEFHETSTARMLEQQHKLREYLRAQLATYYETIQNQSALIDDQAVRLTEAERRHEERMVIATSSVEASRRREGDLLTNIEELEAELALARKEVGEREGMLIRMRSQLVELEEIIRDMDARERALVQRNEELENKVNALEWRVRKAIREAESKEEEAQSEVMEEGGGGVISSRNSNDRDRGRPLVPYHDKLPNNNRDLVPNPRRRRWVRAVFRPWTLFWGK